jgi:hypothetical protein
MRGELKAARRKMEGEIGVWWRSGVVRSVTLFQRDEEVLK